MVVRSPATILGTTSAPAREDDCVEFGIFDHLDTTGQPLDAYYADRLALIRLFERAGFRSYHVAEHHSTPLGMAPSPNLFLSAVAMRTETLRFGPLVFALPLYHPLRLVQEICMLDQMSGGRLEIGFGRGASAIESAYFGNDHAEAEPIYREYLEIVLNGLATGRLHHRGEYMNFRRHSAPGGALPETAPAALVRRPRDRERGAGGAHAEPYREPRQRRGDRHVRSQLPRRMGKRSTAPTARPASSGSACSSWWARPTRTRSTPRGAPTRSGTRVSTTSSSATTPNRPGTSGRPPSTKWRARAARSRGARTRSPRFVGERMAVAEANYLVGQMAFGDLTLEETTRSVELFAGHVMPALRGA